MGGTERVTCSLANEMARHGNEVSIVSVFGVGGGCKFELDGNVRFLVACNRDYGLQMARLERLRMVWQMARELRDNESLCSADVVIAQKFFAAMLAVKAGLRQKLIVGEHYVYGMYSHPVVDLRNAIYRKAKAVVVLTEGCRRDFVRHGVRRVYAVGNMVTIARPEAETAREKVMLAVGRLAVEKGFDLLVTAFSKVCDRLDGWRLEICGEGDERGRLEQLIAHLGLQGRVVLRGQVADVANEYRKASFGVVSSRFEGFSMAILEAAAMRLPGVSFDCPDGPRSILGEGGGILVKNQDVDALAAALVEMAENEALRRKCADETEKIVERYSPENIYTEWMQIIEKSL